MFPPMLLRTFPFHILEAYWLFESRGEFHVYSSSVGSLGSGVGSICTKVYCLCVFRGQLNMSCIYGTF